MVELRLANPCAEQDPLVCYLHIRHPALCLEREEAVLSTPCYSKLRVDVTEVLLDVSRPLTYATRGRLVLAACLTTQIALAGHPNNLRGTEVEIVKLFLDTSEPNCRPPHKVFLVCSCIVSSSETIDNAALLECAETICSISLGALLSETIELLLKSARQDMQSTCGKQDRLPSWP